VLDVVVCSVLLAVLVLPMLLIALAVRLEDRGPALFRQERVGLGRNRFTLFKYRTMFRGGDDRQLRELIARELRGEDTVENGSSKLNNDSRITRTGRFLRRTSLDELPQLLNVLAGSMSLVGPRPPLPSEVAQYGDDVRRRLFVKPGMTGLWQVSGRSDLSWAESVRLDLYYVENWSPSLDLSLVARTVAAVIRGRGAY
jgi:lipopolysaccharide/colanic/teichoic acid biosynthesis glycosyltransferase